MNFVNTNTGELVPDSKIYGRERYAILSHRWLFPNDQEVSYQDMKSGNKAYMKKTGFAKITGACTRAKADGVQYVWIDTCCINKQSSSDLTFNINSMYEWYNNASVCYAHLADVSSDNDPRGERSDFRDSERFDRVWTLQELIAPREVVFFAKNWVEIGTRKTLASVIVDITRIPIKFLKGADPESASIAQRLCWASSRSATVLEDKAYSLMGLFGVNMPLLYGEGEKAFIRLQEEIIKQSDDHSIFAWRFPTAAEKAEEERQGLEKDNRRVARGLPARDPSDEPVKRFSTSGLLASNPALFKASHSIIPHPGMFDTKAYAMTNKGLRISLPLRLDNIEKGLRLHSVAYLACESNGRRIGIYVERLMGAGHQQFERRELTKLYSTEGTSTMFPAVEDIYFRQPISRRGLFLEKPEEAATIFQIYSAGVGVSSFKRCDLQEVYPEDAQQNGSSVRITPTNDRSAVTMRFQMRMSGKNFLVSAGLGKRKTPRPWCAVREQRYQSLEHDHREICSQTFGDADTIFLTKGLIPLAKVDVCVRYLEPLRYRVEIQLR